MQIQKEKSAWKQPLRAWQIVFFGFGIWIAESLTIGAVVPLANGIFGLTSWIIILIGLTKGIRSILETYFHWRP